MVQIINKISTKNVVGGKRQVQEFVGGNTKFRPLMRVVGITGKYETGEGDNGEWVKFKGSFEATNLVTGEVFRSGVCFIPGSGSDMLQTAVDASESEIQLAFDINAKFSVTSAVGYEYSLTSLIEVAENDPLAALKNLLPDMPALEKLEEPPRATSEEKPKEPSQATPKKKGGR